jgi:hypothetical protein
LIEVLATNDDTGEKIRITRRGRLLGNKVFIRFV